MPTHSRNPPVKFRRYNNVIPARMILFLDDFPVTVRVVSEKSNV